MVLYLEPLGMSQVEAASHSECQWSLLDERTAQHLLQLVRMPLAARIRENAFSIRAAS